MDTVLNLGINQSAASGITQITGNEYFALDLYRRFVQMFASVVMGIDAGELVDERRRKLGIKRIEDFSPSDLREAIAIMKALIRHVSGAAISDDPFACRRGHANSRVYP